MLYLVRVLLFTIVLTAIGFLWLMEAIVAAMARHRRSVFGDAWGAPGIVAWCMDLNLRIFGRLKALLGRYVHANHPVAYRHTRWLLVPRRRRRA